MRTLVACVGMAVMNLACVTVYAAPAGHIKNTRLLSQQLINHGYHGRTTRQSSFFENLKLLGLGRQIGPKNVG